MKFNRTPKKIECSFCINANLIKSITIADIYLARYREYIVSYIRTLYKQDQWIYSNNLLQIHLSGWNPNFSIPVRSKFQQKLLDESQLKIQRPINDVHAICAQCQRYWTLDITSQKQKIRNESSRQRSLYLLRVQKFYQTKDHPFANKRKKKKKRNAYKKKTGEKRTLRTSCWAWTLRDSTGPRGKKKKQKEQKRKREWGWPRLKVKNRRDLVVPFKATKQSRDRARLKSSGNTSQSRVPVSTRVASVRFLVNYPRGRPRRAA